MLVKPVKVHFESGKWPTGFAKDVTNGEVLTDVSNNGVLRALPGQSLSDTYSKRNVTELNLLLLLLGYQRLLLRFHLSTDMKLNGKG